ncbi:uncharacterized protein [Ambystoma mexicanum]|uniref:uncharacterized protein n=1 Tax=Ambystoma mexicanum TaxID=8296 RepID=UPI0037E8C58E
MCEPGHSSNPVCSSFKRNEESACQMSAVDFKCISATDGNEAVKITNSVRKWKRKRSQEHNQETVAGTMGKRKKMKQAGCAESVVEKKGKVSKAVSNRCKPLKTKRPLHSQLPVSIVPTDYSCADDTIMQHVLPVVTMNDDLQKLKSTSAEKSTKSMLKNRRPHNKIINDRNTSKIFRGKAKVAKPQSPNVKISSTQQPSAAVPKKGRPQKKLAKDVNLQASPPIPKSLQAGPKNGNALNTIVSSTIQHKLASSKINPVHKRKRKDSCSNLHKLPRKALPAMPKSVNKKKLSAKGASLQKAGRPRSSTVSAKYPSVKGVYRKKSHLTLPKSANSQSRNMEVGSLPLSPAVPKYVCLQKPHLNSGNLKSSSAESKTDQSQEPSVKYDGFQNNGSTPAPNLDATVPSGLSPNESKLTGINVFKLVQ